MAYENTMESQPGSSAVGRPLVTSYDLGYEYSLQHYIEVKCLVEEADRELSSVSTPHLAQAKAA